MTGPILSDEMGTSTQEGGPEPANEHRASSDESCIEDQSAEFTGANQPQDVKSLEGRDSHLVEDETISSGTHEPQDEGNTTQSAGPAGPSTSPPSSQSQSSTPEKVRIDSNRQFLDAAREGNWEVMDSAIKSGASLTAKTRFFDETALHLACRLGYHNVLQNLLKQKPIMDNLKDHMEERDIDKWTPLHSACSNNKTGFKRFFNKDLDDDFSITSQSESHTMVERTQMTLDILFDSQKQSATKFNINARDDERKTALHMACKYSSAKVVSSLVNNGAEVNVIDSSGNTPLMEACRRQSEDVINFLLDKRAEVNVRNRHRSTPLTLACQYLNDKKAAVVKRLLDAKANCDWADNDGDSPLIVASKLGKTAIVREILEHKPKDLNMENKRGESALRCALFNKQARDEMVPLLLNSGCTLDQQDASILFPRRTTESFSGSDLQQSIWLKTIEGMLLVRNQPTGTDLSGTIKPLLEYASNEEKVFAVIRADTDANFEILNEATKELGMRENICTLIRDIERNKASERSDEEIRQMILNEFLHEYLQGLHRSLEFEDIPSTLLQFSALHGDYMLVWYLLKTSQSRKKKDIESAMKIAKGPDADTFQGKPNARGKTESRKPHHDRDSKRYKLTINMLQNAAAIMSMSKQLAKKLPTRPKTADMQDKALRLQRHNAAVIDFYIRGGGEDAPVDLLRASPSVFDLVYASDDSRVDDIMKTAKTTFNEMVTATKNDKINDKRKPQLRWIHLPANHMDWMEHLTERVYSEKNENKKWSSFYDLAQRSRIELPTDGSKIKFMKPICIREEQPQKADELVDSLVERIRDELNDDHGHDSENAENFTETPQKEANNRVAPRMALYAPFITFGYCDISQRGKTDTKYKELEKMYEGSILHGPRSLDRFYYNALSNDKVDERDRSQVVTRGLLKKGSVLGGTVPEEITKWPYLTVDQLWIWVIDEDTIITSSTHREDEFDNLLVDIIFNQLRQGSSKRSGQKTPTSAIEMSQFLISSCIEFIGKLTWQDVCRDHDNKIREDAKYKPVLLLFAEKLNEAMANEKELFRRFRERVEVEKKNSEGKEQRQHEDAANPDPTNDGVSDTELTPENPRENNMGDWDAIHRAAELLDEVKDIRDELIILRFLVSQQEHVWTGLMGTDPDSYDARSPRFTGEELDDMIKKTETIQKSVNELLNLEENSIGIKESMISCEQSEVLVKLGQNAQQQSQQLVELGVNAGEQTSELVKLGVNAQQQSKQLVKLGEDTRKQSEQLVALAKRADQQSEENARQERILMLFTFVTIVFTPLSFMASYYALNTSTSRHNDDGELEYEPRWMNQRIFGISAGIIGPLLSYASMDAIMRWLGPYKPAIWNLIKSKGPVGTIRFLLDVREFVKNRDREKFAIDAERGQRVLHP